MPNDRKPLSDKPCDECDDVTHIYTPVPPVRFERTTSGLGIQRSILLSYEGIFPYSCPYPLI